MEAARKLVEAMGKVFYERLGPYIIGVDEVDLPESVGRLLREKGYFISGAESCTGGTLIGALTDVAGSSDYVNGGFITYTNKAKVKMLGVSEAALKEKGAVSQETALEMVKGLYDKTGSEICVSVTGIAGPGGGSEEKPVGLVYIGLGFKGEFRVHRYEFFGERKEIRGRTVKQALFLIWQYLRED